MGLTNGRRLAFVVTARPSYSRIKSVLTALDKRGAEFYVIPAASSLLRNYGRVADEIAHDFPKHIGPTVHSVVAGGGTQESAISTGLLTQTLSHVLYNLVPDMVVTIADRHETLATAIAASYQNIPLCHIQGGEVSGSIDDRVRNAITQLADLHLVATERAKQNVLRMRPDAYVEVTGCPSIDLAREALELGPLPGHDVVVLQHPVTDEAHLAGEQMRETIKALEGMDVLWFWPGEDAGSDAMSKELRLAGIHPIRNMEPLTFLRTLLGSGVLVGNSSVGVRECSFMGVPAVNIGNRQKGRECGQNVVHFRTTEGLRAWLHGSFDLWNAKKHSRAVPSHLYGDGHAGERIAAILSGARVEAVA